ncbi:MAG: hypothetical protein KVP17_001312 [Porospora cf. gigantea B]|uniref:uncharacterized protein n=1 Tax=Porospora cf. gigantea B TaxID=2853592 RepID=UPI00357196BE|nr:MAG: hypothetical protein KVP17_001312 [Porospora cf. gigantea B]
MILAPVCCCGTLDILRAIFPVKVTEQPKSCMKFWEGVYRAEDAHTPLRALVPPNELLEFFNEGVPIKIQDKSFLFTCVVGLGPLVMSKTAHKAAKSKQLRLLKPDKDCPIGTADLNKLSVCHLLESCEAKRLPSGYGVLELDRLSLQERAQYLREASATAGFAAIQNARWQLLDAAFEAAVLPVAELRLTVLVDMGMLLMLLEEDIADPEHSAKATAWATHVVGMVLLFLGVAGEGDVRAAFFLVQLCFQALRCPDTSKHDVPDDYPGTISALVDGWKALTCGFNASSLPQPIQFDYAYLNEFGVWPIFLNPFKLSGRKFATVKNENPFRSQRAHESLDEVPFVLDAALCAWTPTISSATTQLSSLRKHVTRAFHELKATEGLPLLKEVGAPVSFGRSTEMNVMMDWITSPRSGCARNTVISQMTPLKGDPWGVCLRSKFATGLRNGLGCAFARPDCRFVITLLARLPDKGPVSFLAQWGQQCFCHFAVTDTAAALMLLGHFSSPYGATHFTPEELAPLYRAIGGLQDKKPSSGSVKDRLKWLIRQRHRRGGPPSNNESSSRTTGVHSDTSKSSPPTSEKPTSQKRNRKHKDRKTTQGSQIQQQIQQQVQQQVQQRTDGSQVQQTHILTAVEPSFHMQSQSRAQSFQWTTGGIHRSRKVPIGSLWMLMCK